jgi:hypothetical protein
MSSIGKFLLQNCTDDISICVEDYLHQLSIYGWSVLDVKIYAIRLNLTLT